MREAETGTQLVNGKTRVELRILAASQFHFPLISVHGADDPCMLRFVVDRSYIWLFFAFATVFVLCSVACQILGRPQRSGCLSMPAFVAFLLWTELRSASLCSIRVAASFSSAGHEVFLPDDCLALPRILFIDVVFVRVHLCGLMHCRPAQQQNPGPLPPNQKT